MTPDTFGDLCFPDAPDVPREAPALTDEGLTVRVIVAAWLTEHGYAGLYDDGHDWDGCGCTLDDLMPCEGGCEGCRPGYVHEGRDDGDVVFYVGPAKPEAPAPAGDA